MLGRRAVSAIVGIISACSLLMLLIACCIVYYRRYLTRKAHTYVAAAQADNERLDEATDIEQTRTTNRAAHNQIPDSPPTYSEAVGQLSGVYYFSFIENIMLENNLCRWFCVLFIVSFLFTTCTDGKGFARGGFRGGSKGGSLGGSSSFSRGNSYGSYNKMNKPSSGSSFRKNAMSFGAGALGGVAAYSLMSSMSRSYVPGRYASGYGTGAICTNNEDYNGTRFGQFRCPLEGFPYDAKYCCGEYGKHYCCAPEGRSNRGGFNLLWLCIIIAIVIIAIVVFAKRRRQKDIIMVPVEPPMDEQQRGFFPPPPPMSYPPNVNPYAVPPQNFNGTYTPYPPQQMPYPPNQQPYNPYQVKEAAPPAYNDAMQYNQGMPGNKPM
ncbi:unnamed protein product [Adineta ricciae]|uniref:Shisa N-terminal domain-containing protein n=1 Tax=Adineta ricciae TaxID=249248 RepID=A0A814E4A6_ADIRI|nr:unnamed protein product [Adineta ricciae]